MTRLARNVFACAIGAVVALSAPAAVRAAAPSAAELDKLLAPVALYPDQVLGPMLVSAANPGTVAALGEWLRSQAAKGSELQQAATQAGFGDSYAALVLFPDVVNWMAAQPDWTSRVGKAFTADRSAVFASIQRLRKKAKDAGTLKSTPQQSVATKSTSSGEQVIVIEPANPQVVYVPQYNPQVVYTQPTSSTVVVHEESSGASAAAAGLIGFTAGIAIGAAVDNNYYGWHGGYMYNDAWDDFYDHREDAREDWQDYREDTYENRSERAENAREQGVNRQSTQQQRTAQQNRQNATAATSSTSRSTSQESRGYSGDTRTTSGRSGTKSDAFSGYSSGKSERAASSRGKSSRGSSRSGGGKRR